MAPLADEAKRLGSAPVRILRIVGGAWLLTMEGVAGAICDPAAMLEALELRGVRVQRVARRRWRALEHESGAELERLTESATAPMRWMQREIAVTGVSSAEGMERQVESMLARMGIPSRERLDRLSHEIEELSLRIDRELAAMDAGERKALR